jgi:hypothetical protein
MRRDRMHAPPQVLRAQMLKSDNGAFLNEMEELTKRTAGVTRLPGVFRRAPSRQSLFLTDIEDHLTIVSLNSAEYLTTIRQASSNGIACAIKARAETTYTDNERHFRMFGPEVARRVKRP